MEIAMSYYDDNSKAEKENRKLAAQRARAAEIAMTVARQSPTQANIEIARKAWDSVPSSCGYEIDVICGHEELDEMRVIRK